MKIVNPFSICKKLYRASTYHYFIINLEVLVIKNNIKNFGVNIMKLYLVHDDQGKNIIDE